MAKVFPKLQARIPIIPGVNNDRENILATARFLKQNNQTSIHCLPYHSLGGAKLARINSGLAPFNLKSITAEDLLPIKKMFQEEGIHAVVYD
jgi:pyruvate formate lyase activating enzyme